LKENTTAAGIEYRRVFKNWHGLQVNWLKEFPAAGMELNDKGELDLIHDLMPLNIRKLYRKTIIDDANRANFGFLPVMAGCCDAQLGAPNAEGFAGRIISAANLTLDEGNTLLDNKTLEMLGVLRMNRKFMLLMQILR
jgi:hypothetical protein